MTDRRTLPLLREDLEQAASAGLLPAAATGPLWHWLLQRAEGREAAPVVMRAPARGLAGPAFDFTHILYYLGGMLAIGAATLFLNEAWDRMGAWGLAAIGTGYAAVCVALARRLDARALEVPAGILATLAVCLVPLVVWALQHGLGLWPDGGPARYAQFHTRIDWRWLTLELATLAAAAVALWRLRYAFLMMPVAFTLWYLGQDLARLLVEPAGSDSWTFYRDFTLAFGACIALLGLWVDARSRSVGGSRRDYAFWPYLLGVLSFWAALSARRSDSELDKFLYALLNVGLIGAGALLGRRVFAVCGGLGLAGYLGYLSHKVFHDSLLFPAALTVIGLALMAAGVWWQRHEVQLQVTLRRRLPAALHGWLPADAP